MNRRTFLKNSAGLVAPFILTGKFNLSHNNFGRISEAPTWDEFQTIVDGFRRANTPKRFLGGLKNYKLVETMVLHHDLLQKSSIDESVLRRAYAHYVINTDGAIPDEGFDIKPWLSEYAKLLQLEIKWGNSRAGLLSFSVQRGSKEYVPDPMSVLIDLTKVQSSLRKAGQYCNMCKYGRMDVIPSSLFQFEPQRSNYSLTQAMWMSEFSSTAYFEQADVNTHMSDWGYDFKWLESAHDTQCYIASQSDHAIICFRGTSSFRDLITDAKFFKSRSSNYPGKTHNGFREASEGIWDSLSHEISSRHAGKRLFVTGHSLGAALAQLAAYRLNERGFDVQVYLFGAPNVGNKAFSEAYNASLEDMTYVHINNMDAVTRIPPTFTGFQPVGGHFFKFREDHTVDYSQKGPKTKRKRKSILLSAAQEAFRRATAYLSPNTLPGSGPQYVAGFDGGPLDEHGIAQYLFKLACGIVDEKKTALDLV